MESEASPLSSTLSVIPHRLAATCWIARGMGLQAQIPSQRSDQTTAHAIAWRIRCPGRGQEDSSRDLFVLPCCCPTTRKRRMLRSLSEQPNTAT